MNFISIKPLYIKNGNYQTAPLCNHPAGRQGRKAQIRRGLRLWAPEIKGGADVHGRHARTIFPAREPSYHFYGVAFPIRAIFIISLEAINCLITLLFLGQNPLLITNHNFKDRRAEVGNSCASLSASCTYILLLFMSLAMRPCVCMICAFSSLLTGTLASHPRAKDRRGQPGPRGAAVQKDHGLRIPSTMGTPGAHG